MKTMELLETDIKAMGRPGNNRKYYVRIPKGLMHDEMFPDFENGFFELGRIYDIIFDDKIRIRDQIRIRGTMYYVGINKNYINKKTLEIGKIYEILFKIQP